MYAVLYSSSSIADLFHQDQTYQHGNGYDRVVMTEINDSTSMQSRDEMAFAIYLFS